jgi:LmbE family N-acetylglucosaminyl deacetylase
MGGPCILFFFAHPDDESFSGAGTAMKYRAVGVRSVVVTATRGDKGKAGNPPVCSPGELAAWRERELHEAARIAGFDEVHLLDYHDKELASAPPDDIRRSLVSQIRRLRPLVIATFDANGFNVHPDHVAISRFTTDAVAAAADPRWYPEAGAAYLAPRLVWTPPIAAWDVGTVERLDEQPGVDFVIDVSPWRERKSAALRAHRSQHLSIDRLFFNQPALEERLRIEVWRQAWGPPLRTRPSGDLFEGLELQAGPSLHPGS